MRAFAALLLLALSAFAQDQTPPPTLTGYVTRAASASDFDVNGVRVLCGPNTQVDMPSAKPREHLSEQGCPQPAPWVGLPADVYGERNKKRDTLAATRIAFRPVPLGDVSSYAIVEAVLSRSPHSLEVHADGYRIDITPATSLRFDAPLHSLADVNVNLWITYSGAQRPDGSIRAKHARFTPDHIKPGTQIDRARTDYDPSQVTTRGNRVAEVILGVSARKIPAWPDAAMQARVAAIGAKLIPACQRTLPASSPLHIDFRFQVTASDPWVVSLLALPSGIILVPHQMVDRLRNDDQIAAILAEAMAIELEGQDDRMRVGIPLTKKQAAKEIAADDAAPWFVPDGIGFGYGAALGFHQLVELHRQQDQTSRVSLSLMHQAGYDITQAPIAWWLLDPRHPKPIADIPLEPNVAYFYRILGTVWRNPATP